MEVKNRKMSKVAFFALGLQCILSAVSCQSNEEISPEEKKIHKVESSLSSKIILSGEGFDSALWGIKDRMEFYNISAVSVTFFDGGQIKWSRAYGTKSHSDLTRITENTIFQAASISKPVTAIGVLKLMENGKVDIDAPANSYLKSWQITENEYTKDRPVTIRDLLSHTSGMTVTGFDGYRAGDTIPNLIEILDGVAPSNSKPVRVDTIPGNVFKYSGGGYTILQKLIEDVTGSSFQDYMSKNVLKEAGMKNSFFIQPLPSELELDAAIGHSGDGQIIPGKYNTYPELAAAGLWTTPSDLAQLAIGIQRAYQGSNEEVISSSLAKTLLEEQVDDWGLGLILVKSDSSEWFTHGGSNAGYRCTMIARIKDGQGVVIMTNGNQGARLYNEILRSFSISYNWDIFKPKTRIVIRLPKDQLGQFTGKYGHLPENKYQVNVGKLGDFLEITQLWNDIKFPIYSMGRNDFIEGEEGVSFDFKRNENGSIKELVINGDWVLTKLE